MAVLGELLFYRRDQVTLGDVLRVEVNRLQGRVDALPDKIFTEKNDPEIAAQVSIAAAFKALVVDFAAAQPFVQEREVDVPDVFDQRLIRVPGLRATKSIPFTGDPGLWRLGASWNLNPPRGDVQGNKLIVGIDVRANATDEAVRYIDGVVAELPQYLQQQEALIAEHNATLAFQAMRWITARRQRLGSASDLLKKLGG